MVPYCGSWLLSSSGWPPTNLSQCGCQPQVWKSQGPSKFNQKGLPIVSGRCSEVRGDHKSEVPFGDLQEAFQGPLRLCVASLHLRTPSIHNQKAFPVASGKIFEDFLYLQKLASAGSSKSENILVCYIKRNGKTFYWKQIGKQEFTCTIMNAYNRACIGTHKSNTRNTTHQGEPLQQNCQATGLVKILWTSCAPEMLAASWRWDTEFSTCGSSLVGSLASSAATFKVKAGDQEEKNVIQPVLKMIFSNLTNYV